MSAKRLLPLTGILAVALMVVAGSLTGDTPDTDAPVKEVVSFYTEHDSDAVVGGLLMGIGALALLTFVSVLRNALRPAEGASAGASTLSFAGGILFVVGITIFAGLQVALGDAPDKIDPVAVQTMHVLNENMFPALAVGNIAFLLGSGVAIIKTAVLPKWLGWAAVVVGVLGVTPLWFVPLIGVGLFLIIASVLLTMRAETA
jgi:hypothetical protein